MDRLENRRKQLYDATVNLIVDLHLQKGLLDSAEMHCLLSILDLIMMGKDDWGLVDLLRDWESGQLDTELREIVHATLLSIDFSDLQSQQGIIDTIRDLLRYNNELGDDR